MNTESRENSLKEILPDIQDMPLPGQRRLFLKEGDGHVFPENVCVLAGVEFLGCVWFLLEAAGQGDAGWSPVVAQIRDILTTFRDDPDEMLIIEVIEDTDLDYPGQRIITIAYGIADAAAVITPFDVVAHGSASMV